MQFQYLRLAGSTILNMVNELVSLLCLYSHVSYYNKDTSAVSRCGFGRTNFRDKERARV